MSERKTIEVKGMSCNHCVQSVTQALSGLDGLANVKVDLAFGTASYDLTKPVEETLIKETISNIGFIPGAIR